MKTINARGKACPEPVALTKKAIEAGEEELEILLDNPVSASNVIRFLESRGFGVRLQDDEGMLTVSARKKASPASLPQEKKELPKPPAKQPFSVLIASSVLGQNDSELGEVLMKSFLGTLVQMENCSVVALMNEGVKLALYDSSACDHLKKLEKRGVMLLVCGTCINHFGLSGQIGAGLVSNMFEIVESLNRADKVISL